jgi:proton-dependent oligopeptide transporter, POT family
MFKGHPKGLFVLFLANMGERFGFYTMIAIFVLFLQAKYGFSPTQASMTYGSFMMFVYFLPLLGGIIADRVLGYGKTIGIGLMVMFAGYLLLAIPTAMNTGFPLIIGALAIISLGTGLFKGNVQALVGNLYDEERYNSKRDIAFNVFYMGINIGAMFAPTAAGKISNWFLSTAHYTYDARIPILAHQYLSNHLNDANSYLSIAKGQDPSVSLETLGHFSEKYINTLSHSYHYGFGMACLSLIISMIIFWGFRKYYRQADYNEKQKAANQTLKNKIVELSPEQTKQRMMALGLVFLVVIFFWMSFHQNGLCLTYFARDYTVPQVNKLTNTWFDLFGLLPILLSVVSLVLIFRKGSSAKYKIAGIVGLVVFGCIAILRIHSYPAINSFTPQMFQHFNPFFIVALTPLVILFFSYLHNKDKEPSAPKKIGIGMLLAASGFAIMAIGSVSLLSPHALQGQVAPSDMLVSPYWLISTYFTLTIAEIFLSPMGISFVSKVAPPKYKGLMQGGWFAATAIGNQLVGIVGSFWDKLELWQLWSILTLCCLLSAGFMFIMLKKLEKAANS